MNRVVTWSLAALLSIAVPASALTVSGTITDVLGTPIPGIRVEVYDEDPAIDDLLEVVYTDAAGNYSSSLVSPGDDIYVVVKWEWELTPGGNFGNHVVRLVDQGNGSPYVATTAFTPVTMPTTANVNSNLAVSVTLGQQAPAGLSNLQPQVQKVLSFVYAFKGSAPWAVTYDIPVHVRLDNAGSYFAGGDMWVDHGTFNGMGTTKQVVDMFHEVGHLVHYRHNGDQLPPFGANCAIHSINTEEDPGCGLVESYPSYMAHLTAVLNGSIAPFYQAYQDDGSTGAFPANSLWRGDEAMPTGRQGMSWESGEVVEGAVAGFFFGVHNAFNFERVLKTMMTHKPATAFGLIQGLAQDAGLGPATNLYFERLEMHGLVYSRSRFSANPFADGPPPNVAPPDAGNHRLIAGFNFVRGQAQMQIEDVPPADLGVAQTLAISEVQAGRKAANNGSADLPTDPAWTFGPASPAANGVVVLDTPGFGGASGDGSWDLLVRSTNLHGAADSFRPVWAGDGTATLAADELYLKTLGTWFDRDRNPATNQDPEGMVIVDNTAPTVSNFKP